MSFFPFGRRKSAQKRQTQTALHMAAKVLNYRRDVLSASAIGEVEAARTHLLELTGHSADGKKLPKGQGGKVESTGVTSIPKATDTNALIDQAIANLAEVLKRHGGKIYPGGTITENVEMLVVAAILAIGIRSFFFQPFKIPTNSMWPTYAGMIPVVYDAQAGQRPNLPQRLVNRALFWASNFYIPAPTSGELLIPVLTVLTDTGAEAQLLHQGAEESQLFGLRQVPINRYPFGVGSDNVDVNVPRDFPLEPVVLKTYFPQFESLQAALDHYAKEGKVQIRRDMGTRAPVHVIRTGIILEKGDPVLSFDIKTGDMLFVDRFSYNFVQPKVGDPIVFRTDNIAGLRTAMSERGPFLPDERYYIKRLVGVGGDKLTIDGTALLRNGEPITGAEAFKLNATRSDSYPGYQARWRLADGKTETIKDGYFYALGDNSPESYDSRGWGMDFTGHYLDRRTPEEKSAGVPDNQVRRGDTVGKAMFIFYPLEPRWGLAK